MSKKFQLRFDTGNAAFDPDPTPEICRILREVADRIEKAGHYAYHRNVFDVNGNVIGTFTMKDEEHL